MIKRYKKLLLAVIIIAVLLTIFFVAPKDDYNKEEEDRKKRMQNMQTFTKWEEPRNSYFSYCLGWWSMKFVKKQEPETPINDVQEEKNPISPEWNGIIQNALKNSVIYTAV